MKIFKVRGISFLLAIMTFLYTFNFSYANINANALENTAYEIGADQELLSEAKAILKRYYIDPIAEEVLAAGSISEMISKLNDPYSDYFTKEEYNDFVNSIDNRFVGIGVNIEVVAEGIKVINVMKGSPAEEVGIKVKDIIVKANNINLVGLSAEEAVKYIKGAEGTTVAIAVKRENTLLDFLVTRRVISMPTVEWEVKNSIGYISINSFGENTGKEFSNALNALSLSNINAYIVDLRFNGGGYITSALDIGGYFIGNNPMTLIEDNEGTRETYKGYYHDNTIDKPIIFLINEYSASASELLSAAIKDYKKAFFIGTTTYGKGVGQSMLGLSDGSMLKLTTIEFYSPLGNAIHQVGVAPDFSVNADVVDSFSVGYLLFSGLSANTGSNVNSNDDYIKVNMDGSTFYIDLNEARKPEYWQAYKYIMSNVSKDNIFVGSGDKWISYSIISGKSEIEILYPNSRFLNDLSKSVNNVNYTITFNRTVNINSIDEKDIELISYETGERIAYKMTNAENTNKINISLEENAEAGTYYFVINNDSIMDMNNVKLGKRNIGKIIIN